MMAAEPVVKNANYKKRRGHNTAEPINYISKLLHVLAPQAASTVRASVRFAAALCEISGSFLIFPFRVVRREPHSTILRLRF